MTQKIAIIGAGLAGLSVAHFLLELGNFEITLFDERGVGGGASGVCSGLLHPYPGLAAKRTHRATDAILTTRELLRLAENYTPRPIFCEGGILREPLNDEALLNLRSHVHRWGDVEEVSPGKFLIHSGITVLMDNYLDGLFNSLQKRGVVFEQQKVRELSSSFDHTVIAAGWGVRELLPGEEFRFVKGQACLMRGELKPNRSSISKGYIATLGNGSTFDLGSTYERTFADDKPDWTLAKTHFAEKIARECPSATIEAVRAGVRVNVPGSYLPRAELLDEKTSVFTGLGSRGLLYHALYGKLLSQKVVDSFICQENCSS